MSLTKADMSFMSVAKEGDVAALHTTAAGDISRLTGSSRFGRFYHTNMLVFNMESH